MVAPSYHRTFIRFLVSQAPGIPLIRENIPHKEVATPFGCCRSVLIEFPVVYLFYLETGNLRLEDVDLIFSRGGDPVKQARMMAAELKAHGRIESGEQFDEKEINSIGVEHI